MSASKVNIPISFSKEDFPYRELLLDTPYEHREISAISNYPIEDTWRILDLGAGLGIVSAHAALRTNGRVVSVEANPEIHELSKEVFVANKLSNVTPVLAQVSLTSGEDNFYVHSNFLRSKRRPEAGHNDEYSRINSVAVTLDDLFTKFGAFDMIIADVEGAETEIFDDFSFIGVKVVVLELHPHLYGIGVVKDILQKFTLAGFTYDPQYSDGTVVTLTHENHDFIRDYIDPE